MIRFVVWGAGDRGRIAAEIFGADRIVAFIDSDPAKSGGTFYGKPVIDLTYYKDHYSDYAILVSLVTEQLVTDILTKEKIFFFSYNECPPELDIAYLKKFFPFILVKDLNEIDGLHTKKFDMMNDAVKRLSYHINAYQKTKNYGDKKGIRIYNATRGRYSEILNV